MNDSQIDTDNGALRPRTVAIVFSVVGLVFIIACLTAGAWPLAVGAVIAIVLLPVFILLANILGRVVIIGPLHMLSRLLPERFRSHAAEQRLHPVTIILIFAGLAGVLFIIFRDIRGVIAGLLIGGLLVGFPMLAEWSREQKKKKTANKALNPTKKSGAAFFEG